ncbi:MAG: hypothetical protein JO069_11365 [Verrucomicrobia bacterium]|nr:hypothetical protein [Verrucomicrobiota bacterium]
MSWFVLTSEVLPHGFGHALPLNAASSILIALACSILPVTLLYSVRRRKSEAATRQSNEQIREQAALLDHAPVFVHDLEHRIVRWTRGVKRLYGFTEKEALGRLSHEPVANRILRAAAMHRSGPTLYRPMGRRVGAPQSRR